MANEEVRNPILSHSKNVVLGEGSCSTPNLNRRDWTLESSGAVGIYGTGELSTYPLYQLGVDTTLKRVS